MLMVSCFCYSLTSMLVSQTASWSYCFMSWYTYIHGGWTQTPTGLGPSTPPASTGSSSTVHCSVYVAHSPCSGRDHILHLLSCGLQCNIRTRPPPRVLLVGTLAGRWLHEGDLLADTLGHCCRCQDCGCEQSAQLIHAVHDLLGSLLCAAPGPRSCWMSPATGGWWWPCKPAA